MSNEHKPLLRYDPVRHEYTGGWSYDTSAIKESPDGDYVKFEDYESERAKLKERVRERETTLSRINSAYEACVLDILAERAKDRELIQLLVNVAKDRHNWSSEYALGLAREAGITPIEL